MHLNNMLDSENCSADQTTSLLLHTVILLNSCARVYRCQIYTLYQYYL